MTDTRTVEPLTKHPARFSDAVLDTMRSIVEKEAAQLGRRPRLLDPFAGVGKIHALDDVADTVGVELQPRWAACHERTRVGDATRLPHWWTDRFDIAATSPCLSQEHRVLTDDLRWVPVGDLRAGDRLLAFDEVGGAESGTASRRRWQRADVVRSVPRRVECVRVVLANGDEIVTTPEHPWLAGRYAYGGQRQSWVASSDLLGSTGLGATRGHRLGQRQPWYVMRQLDTWTRRHSYDAGWLAGMFDGEGSLSLGVHGSPKLTMYQVDGIVLDKAERLLIEMGYATNRIPRKQETGRQPVHNLYVTGGFPVLLRALGELRPTRLLDKWLTLDVSTRTVQAERVQVVAVEPAGVVDIQEIETTSGTYIGEGYLHHNCYGNRLSDHHDARDKCKAAGCEGGQIERLATPDEVDNGHELGVAWDTCSKCKGSGLSVRRSYTHDYGAPLERNNAGTMPFGSVAYELLHRRAWRQVRRVLRSDGLFLLNVSDFVRKSATQPVVGWHTSAVRDLGFKFVRAHPVDTPRLRYGSNADARAAFEYVLVFRNGKEAR